MFSLSLSACGVALTFAVTIAEVEESLATLTTSEVLRRMRENDLPGSQVLGIDQVHTGATPPSRGSAGHGFDCQPACQFMSAMGTVWAPN